MPAPAKSQTRPVAAPSTRPRARKSRTREEALARARARKKADWEACEFDLGGFIPAVSAPQGLTCPEHFREALDVLDESMRRPMIILLEGPPRHGKTLTVLHHIARFLRFRPEQQVAYASYSAGMALRKSRLTREIAYRAGVWSQEMAPVDRSPFKASEAVTFWQTQHGGGLISGGRGGQFVGEGFGLIVIDDPSKNRKEAESAVVQDEINEALFEGTLFTRRAPGASVIVTHQPWNDSDLISYLVEKFDREGIEYVRISLPAVSEAEFDGDGRLTGGRALWPLSYPIRELRIIQAAIGDYNFDSQYMLQRVPKGTRVFAICQRFSNVQRDGVLPLLSCDPGISKDEKRDPSAFVEALAYLDPEGLVCLDILCAEEVNIEIPETVDELEVRSQSNGNCTVLIEEVSAFASVSQMARRLDEERVMRGMSPAQLDLVPIVPQGSKLVRSQGAASGVKFGRIRVPMNADWVPKFLTQLKRFTGRPGGKDNMVDALTQLYDYAYLHLGNAHDRPQVGGPSELASGGGF